MTTTAEKLKGVEKILNLVMGVKVEITIRGLKDFTVCFPGDKPEAVTKLKKWLKKNAQIENVVYDEELAETYVYFKATI